jgi:uncharacterized protein
MAGLLDRAILGPCRPAFLALHQAENGMDRARTTSGGPSLAEKVAFLSGPAFAPRAVATRETHMSWLFFVGDEVFKLKKPLRLPYLDFSTLARREAACRAEHRLNQALAPGVYLGITPLTLAGGDLALGGEGAAVDWLVRMRRLDEAQTLESALRDGAVGAPLLDRLAAVLARFYGSARPVPVGRGPRLLRHRRALHDDAGILLDPALPTPKGLVRGLLALQRRFLRLRPGLIAARRWVEGHGDLRPEHIWLGPDLLVIDRLEFSAGLRTVDPLEEVAFLDLECERLGAPSVGAGLRRRIAAGLHDEIPAALYLFYRIQRALLRARLAIAHLQEPSPRTPAKWPAQMRAYLRIARRDARQLERRLRRPADR